jgi:hypothetical protein
MTDEINEIIRVLQLTTADDDDWDADNLTCVRRALVSFVKRLRSFPVLTLSDLEIHRMQSLPNCKRLTISWKMATRWLAELEKSRCELFWS